MMDLDEVVNAWIAEIYAKFSLPVDCTWKWNYRALRTAGKAFPVRREMQFSYKFFQRVDENEQRDTVVHEVCHLIAFKLYGDKGHKEGWKHCMLVCGHKPERCHKYDFFEHRRKSAFCACGEVKVGPIKYNWIASGKKTFFCSRCKQQVTPVNDGKKMLRDVTPKEFGDFFHSMNPGKIPERISIGRFVQYKLNGRVVGQIFYTENGNITYQLEVKEPNGENVA